jgi:TPR repeat protein
MRTSDVVLSIGLLALAFGLSSAAVSFDGTRSPDAATVAVPLPPGSSSLGSATPLAPVPTAPVTGPGRSSLTPFEAFRSGTQALRQGKTNQGVEELEFAAEQGVPGAIWKLGRMYADGDGVGQDKARAFKYFRRLTNAHGDIQGTPQARFVANAFVALGQYHLEGIPGSVKADAHVAHDMFRYAASYFADPEAQYQLGRLYLLGTGVPKDPMQAARWLRLAANKGEYRAQALLGALLFKGEEVQRQAALGLFWLIVAHEGAGADDGSIAETYSKALAQATDGERALARKYLENWLKGRRE